MEVPWANYLAIIHSALQEAQEIFGVDFDYDEFEKYNEYDEELEEEYEYEDDEAEGEIRVRPKKTTKKRVSRRSIFEMYEPSELESSHLTDQDNEIRATDLPERFQVRNHLCCWHSLGILLCFVILAAPRIQGFSWLFAYGSLLLGSGTICGARSQTQVHHM